MLFVWYLQSWKAIRLIKQNRNSENMCTWLKSRRGFLGIPYQRKLISCRSLPRISEAKNESEGYKYCSCKTAHFLLWATFSRGEEVLTPEVKTGRAIEPLRTWEVSTSLRSELYQLSGHTMQTSKFPDEW